ncbi:MAG: hypothetical protein LC118_21585 [Dehalococcoidia bacterium]|nr:hypothetical protein [Dehalococcoidia bacterium]
MLRIDPELERSISRITDLLAAEFAPRISRTEVVACVHRNARALAAHATVPDYIPVLLIRNCRQQLRGSSGVAEVETVAPVR